MAISKEVLEKVNEFARIAKQRELTAEEKEEQKKVRSQYLQEFRSGMKQVLDNVDVVRNVTIAKPLKEVKKKLDGVEGIECIKEVGFNLTEVTFNVKHHDEKSIIKLFKV